MLIKQTNRIITVPSVLIGIHIFMASNQHPVNIGRNSIIRLPQQTEFKCIALFSVQRKVLFPYATSFIPVGADLEREVPVCVTEYAANRTCCLVIADPEEIAFTSGITCKPPVGRHVGDVQCLLNIEVICMINIICRQIIIYTSPFCACRSKYCAVFCDCRAIITIASLAHIDLIYIDSGKAQQTAVTSESGIYPIPS